MARKLDFGNDLDVPLRGICNNFPEIGLGVVVWPVLDTVELGGVFLCAGVRLLAVPRARRTHRAVLHEVGIAGNVHTPALVFG